MKIKSVDTILTCPARNFVIVRIETDDGIVGYGDATLNGRELAVKAAIDSHISRCLIGHDAERITDIWEMLYRGTYWRGGPVLMTALSGIDMALWDIKGKKYNAPLYQLFGGKCRDRLRAYFHVHGHTKEALAERIREHMQDGCTCFRYSFDTESPADSSVFFTQPHQDFGAGKKRLEIGAAEATNFQPWDTASYSRDLINVTDYLRSVFGNTVDLLHDSHERFTPTEAAAAAKALEPYELYFLEDPIEPNYVKGLEAIRNASTTPIAMGELYTSLKDCMVPIESGLIDYLRIDISHFGGITPSLRAAVMADQHAVKLAFHGPSDISPLAHAAFAHIDYAIPNFGIQEWMDSNETVNSVFHSGTYYKDGHVYVSDEPGLGVTVDEEAAARYPYTPGFIPMLRDQEGAIHNW
ncbi:MAG: D-galactonate dehydratase family protein [Oscillospiraceae bacterium]